MNQLAVIIPAYKSQYLREALDCFVNQTNKNFNLYIGDDNSPEELEQIIAPYRQNLPVTYCRFNSNIGPKKIVDQWERCIDLIQDEEWIWLFSDDDLVDTNAVDSFWKTLSVTGGGHDIYSFNTCVINKMGETISKAPEIPDFESSEQMAFNLLMGKRANCMPDHIFSKKIFKEKNGFVKTLYGQGADWANSILFSQRKGIKIIPDALVYWRYSGENITSLALKNKTEMIAGHFQFIQWILDHFKYLMNTDPSGERYAKIKKAALYNLRKIITEHYQGIPFSKLLFFAYFVRKNFQVSMKDLSSDIMKYNVLTIQYRKKRNQQVHSNQ